jgi:hypothetical protein
MARSSIFSFGGSTATTTTTGSGSTTGTIYHPIFLAIAESNIIKVKSEISKTSFGSFGLASPSIFDSTRDMYGNTPLHAAINMGNREIIQALIDHGCDLSIKNKRGETCYDLLSRSDIGPTIEYLATRHLKTIDSCRIETRSKTLEIQGLKTEIRGLEESNTKQYGEIQTLKIELLGKRKQVDELETQCANLRRAAKKPKA